MLDPGGYKEISSMLCKSLSFRWNKIYIGNKKINPDEIKEINCIVPKVITSNLTYNNPQTVKEAQFSMQFSIAMIIRFVQLNWSTFK